MEGVVLYVILVRVFIQKSKKCYLALFTVLSYGEWSVYMKSQRECMIRCTTLCAQCLFMTCLFYDTGLPLLYMCVTVPLGFRKEQSEYGYEDA